MSQVICPNPTCRTPNRVGARFCSSCGTQLPAAPPPQPSAPPQQPWAAPGPVQPASQAGFGLGTGRLPPQSLINDRYLILKKVGQGGMGAVYQVVDTRINRVCAVKEMSDAAILDPHEKMQAVHAFQREADLLARLTHPNLPKVSDKFAVSGKHFLVMEYIDGETLHQKISRGEAPFPEEQVIQWTDQLCDVLGYLHSQRPPIIFRDIKPDNIMVDRDGQVKLIDMGIVRFFKPGQNKDTTLLGTPGYAAPEQYGTGQTDARSDIYSLGATLFHLVTGHTPDEFDLYQLPPVRQVNNRVSPQMDQLITRALSPIADRRWQSMAEMRSALQGGAPASTLRGPIQQMPEAPFPSGRSGGTVQVPMPGGAHPAQAPGTGTAMVRGAGRPTARLVEGTMKLASQLSTGQLVAIGVVALALIIAGILVLGPAVREISFIWRNVPLVAIVGPLAYAAVRRKGVAGVAQAVTAGLGGSVLWLRIGFTQGDFVGLISGALLSGLAMEALLWFLPSLTGGKSRQEEGVWQREVVWLALVTVVGHVVLSLLATTTTYALNPWAWLSAAVLGAGGWFLGDMVQEYLRLRRTGTRRSH